MSSGPYESPGAHLLDELERLACAVQGRDTLEEKSSELAARLEESRRAGFELPLQRLRAAFSLSPFELDVLLACLAPLVDPGFGELFSGARGDREARFPTGELLLELFAPDRAERIEALDQLHPRGTLFEWRLLHAEGAEVESAAWYLRPIAADLRVLAFLLGRPGFDPLIARELTATPIPDPQTFTFEAADRARIAHALQRLQEREPDQVCFVHLRGSDADAARDVASALTVPLGGRPLELDAERLLGLAASSVDVLEDRVLRIARDALLYRGSLLITHADLLSEGAGEAPEAARRAVLSALAHRAPVVFFTGADAALHAQARRLALGGALSFIDVELPRSTHARRRAAWEQALGTEHAEVAEALASRHELSGEEIRGAVELAADLARSRPGTDGALSPADLDRGIRSRLRAVLGGLATRVDERRSWPELVLPPGSIAQLRELCAQRTCRRAVIEEWGFGERLQRGLGLHALFAGPPGTGKTMAVSILAAELGLELYKIDLSTVVSKYIGETEKNLSRLFREAAHAELILFFDEADVLFARRTKVEDAHDRYANLETGYLLQKMEEHPGITVLATNLQENIEQAFLRRMGFVVDFPFPDPAHRRMILEGLLPRAAPRADDLDLDYLAEHLQLAGGNLRNVVVRAAFAAAEAKEPIGMDRMLAAARREYEKLGKPFLSTDFPAGRS